MDYNKYADGTTPKVGDICRGVAYGGYYTKFGRIEVVMGYDEHVDSALRIKTARGFWVYAPELVLADSEYTVPKFVGRVIRD